MKVTQNTTNSKSNTDSNKKGVGQKALTPAQQAWIDYRAMSGLVIRGENMIRVSVTEFASQLGVGRETLYDWQTRIPDFWKLVSERRAEMGSHERLMKVHEVWYLKALEFKDWNITKEWLVNFDPQFKTATQKIDVDASDNVSDLLNIIRQRREQRPVMDGEIVNDNQTNEPVYIEAEYVNKTPETLHTEQPMQSNEPNITQAHETVPANTNQPTSVSAENEPPTTPVDDVTAKPDVFEPPQHNEWA